MKTLTGKLSVFASNSDEPDRAALIDEINRAIHPAIPATDESVYIGVLLAASNKINAQGGCFAMDELYQMARLVPDAPIMVGHRKDDLPIGRVFKGEIIDRDGAPWLRAFFYWHRDQRRAEALKIGIDAGIYKECSLAFLYAKPECAVCRGDMRQCRHRVGETVRVGDRETKAFYYYKGLDRVLEISLVYRGAVSDTAVSTLDLSFEKDCDTKGNPSAKRRFKPEDFFELVRDEINNAWLLLHISDHTSYLKLIHIGGRRQSDTARLVVKPAEENGELQRPSRTLYLLDKGSVIVPPDEHGVMELRGKMLNGSYQLVEFGAANGKR